MTDVYQIRLVNGDLIVARVYDHNTWGEISMEYAMVQEFLGDNAALLSKYLPFSEDNFLTIHESKVIAMKRVTPEFEKYYHNCVEYNATVVEPSTLQNLKAANYNMSKETKKETRDFVKKAAKLHVDLAPLKEGPKH